MNMKEALSNQCWGDDSSKCKGVTGAKGCRGQAGQDGEGEGAKVCVKVLLETCYSGSRP